MSNPSPTQRQPNRPALRGLVWVGLGCSLVIIFKVLKALEVGSIGAPTDIGGGSIPVVGYLLIVVGVLKLAAAACARWSRR